MVIECPVCSTKLTREVVEHAWIKACPKCRNPFSEFVHIVDDEIFVKKMYKGRLTWTHIEESSITYMCASCETANLGPAGCVMENKFVNAGDRDGMNVKIASCLRFIPARERRPE